MNKIRTVIIIFILTTFSLYSQIYSWKTETKDTLSKETFDNFMSVDLRHSFIADNNRLVLVGDILSGKDNNYLYSPYLRRYPFVRIFNTSTGQEIKNNCFGSSHEFIYRTIDTNTIFIGDSLDTTSLNDINNWITEIDTTFDTLDITVQYPMKTIKVGNEYWLICASMFYENPYLAPVPCLFKMDKDFNIIEKIDKINKNNSISTDSMSLVTYHNSIFYDENKKQFICFPPMSNSLVIKQFDTALNFINQIEEDFNFTNIIPSIYTSFMVPTIVSERIDNGNYVVWYYNSFRSSNLRYYRFVSHRLYDSDLNLIMERKRIYDDEQGYRDSGIVKIPNKIIKNPNTGGYFVYAYSNTGLLVEEYSSNGDSVRTIYFDASDVFPECNITDQVLYRDGRFTFIGLRKETENDMIDSTYYKVYLVETDEACNVIWQYKVPNTIYTGERPEVILGEGANIYYISGVNVTPNPYDEYESDYYNFIVMKIENYSSISETNPSSDIIVAPNPITSTFTFDYTLQTSGPLTITITDLLGEQITEEYNSYAEAGVFTKTINIEKLLPGTYYLNILHDGKITVKKIIKI